MRIALLNTLITLVPAWMLFVGSVALIGKGKTTWSLLQLVGAGCLAIVPLAHLSEGRHLFGSAGHYVGHSAAILGLTLFPIGYLVGALRRGGLSGGSPV